MEDELLIEDAPPFESPYPPIEDAQAIPLQDPSLTPYYGQHGVTYVAPFVDEFGRTRSTAYEPQAESMAMRVRGQEEFRRLVEGGATPAEAYRLTGHLLNYNNPEGLDRFGRTVSRGQQSFTPSMQPVEGGRLLRRGPNSVQFIPERAPQMPPEVKAKQELVKAELSALRREAGNPITGSLVDKNRLSELEKQYVAGSTNWMNQATTPEAPAKTGTVYFGSKEGEPKPTDAKKQLTKDLAVEFVRQAGGDKNKARQLARDAGYIF